MSKNDEQSKKARTRALVLALLREHAASDGLPTTIRFLFYELEQRGLAVKPDREGERKGMRRSVGWPPGSQDITDAVIKLREDGTISWDSIADTERSVDVTPHWTNMRAFLNDALDSFRLNPFEPDEPPLILTESRGNAEVLSRVASQYCCPIAGVKGFVAGFLRTKIAPLFKGNEREVLYLGDYDRSGFDIENNARKTLQNAVGRVIAWKRIALTQTQIDAGKMEPIWKVDKRDGQGHDAWECEALGQNVVVSIVRKALAAQLRRYPTATAARGRTLESVLEREQQLIDEARLKIRRLRV
jgi:hypothetical protein